MSKDYETIKVLEEGGNNSIPGFYKNLGLQGTARSRVRGLEAGNGLPFITERKSGFFNGEYIGDDPFSGDPMYAPTYVKFEYNYTRPFFVRGYMKIRDRETINLFDSSSANTTSGSEFFYFSSSGVYFGISPIAMGSANPGDEYNFKVYSYGENIKR